MSEIAQKTIEAIEQRKLEPRARWRYQAKNAVFWLVLAVSLAVSAIVVATIIFIVSDYDWDAYTYLNRSFFAHIFYSLPYFWLAVLVFLLAFAYYDFRSTKRGYRYDLAIVLGGAAALSVMAGAGLFWAGLDSQVDEFMEKDFPPYESLIYNNEDIWNNPDLGLLGGRVVEVDSEDSFIIKDSGGLFWQVNGQNAAWFDLVPPSEGMRVKLTGRRGDDHIFFADEAEPWE